MIRPAAEQIPPLSDEELRAMLDRALEQRATWGALNNVVTRMRGGYSLGPSRYAPIGWKFALSMEED